MDPATTRCTALAALTLLAAAATADSVAFRADASCPTDAALSALARVDGVSDRRSCLVECAARLDCAAVHAKPVTAGLRCYLGSYANWTSPDAWNTSSACETLVRLPSVPAALAGRLRVFYNFRLGYDNLVGNGTPAAVPSAEVSRSRDGAFFPATFAANLEVAGPLRLTLAAGFAFFAKLKAAAPDAAYLPVNLHIAFNSTRDIPTGYWTIQNTQTSLLHRAVSSAKMDATAVPGFSLSSSTPSLLSLAVVYDPAANTYRFYNGGSGGHFVAPGSVTNTANSGAETADTRVQIGYNNAVPIAGNVICYAIAGAALTEDELRALDAMC